MRTWKQFNYLPPSSSYSEAEILEKVTELRTSLLGNGYQSVGDTNETHQCAEANLKKNQELKRAFGIREDYVDGSSFSVMGKPGEAPEAIPEKKVEES